MLLKKQERIENVRSKKKDGKLCTAGADPKHNNKGKSIVFLKPESSKIIKGETKLSTTKLATAKTRSGLKDFVNFPN